MRTSRLPLLIAAGCLVPLIAHVALAQGDPVAPPVPVPPVASGSAAPGAPSTTDTAAPTPGPSSTVAPTASGSAMPPPTETAPVVPPPPPTETAPAPPPPPVAPVTASAAPPPAPVPVAAPPAESDKPAKKRPPQTTFAIEGDLGATARVGSISSGYDAASRTGLLYGGGLFFAPNRQWAFGLTYAYSMGGREYFNPTNDDSTGNIERRLQTVALNLRAYPVRNDSIGLFTALMIGGTWQTASANGSYTADTFPASPTRPYKSDGGPNGGLALGASVGMDLDLDTNLGMLTSVNFTHHRLTSDPMSGSDSPQIPGIGNTSQIDFRLAFQYRFDVSGKSMPVSGGVKTGSR